MLISCKIYYVQIYVQILCILYVQILVSVVLAKSNKRLQFVVNFAVTDCIFFSNCVIFCSIGLISFPLTAWESTRMTAIGLNCNIVILMWVRILRFYQCSSRLGPMWIMIRSVQLTSNYIRSDRVKSGQIRSGQVRSGKVRSGLVWSGLVRSSQVRSTCEVKSQVR